MTDAELQRYARHLLLDGVGIEGQQRWLDAHALVVGAGGLGSTVLLSLAAAGVGRITVVDPDHVELTNLQRQLAHSQERLGWAKVDSAAVAMRALNPAVQVQARCERADAHSLPGLLQGVDVVLDGCDNFATRQAVNAACVRAGVPLVWAAASGWDAQGGVWLPGHDAPCYACAFPPEAPVVDQACALMGVFAPLVGLVGLWQAGEALKLLLGAPPATHALWLWDARRGQSESMRMARRATCSVCADAHAG